MAINWYQCKHCGIAIKKDASPNNGGCSEKTYHSWTKLGEVGDKNFSCKKCGTTVQTKSTPATSGCPDATYHSWTKL